MLPAIVPLPTSRADEQFSLPPPSPVPANKYVMSFLPSVRAKAGFNYSPLEHIDQLLPLIKNGIKESRSKVANDLLTKMAMNNRLLFYELTAIRIQSIVRKYLSRLRVARMKRRMALFFKITKDCAERYLEEFILANCFEISLEFYRHHMRFRLLQDSVERELVVCAEEIIADALVSEIEDAAKETISSAIDVVVKMRKAAHLSKDSEVAAEQPITAPVQQKVNPLVTLVGDLAEEGLAQCIRSVVFQAVQEEVEEYVLTQDSERVYALIASEVMLEVLIDVVQIYFGEAVDTSCVLVQALQERLYAQYRAPCASPSPPRERRASTMLQRRRSTHMAFFK